MIKIIKQKTYDFLRQSEKYTKTDMVYLFKGGSWLTGGQIVSSMAVFLSAIAFANLVPREVYGTYKYIISIAGILTIATLRGMATVVTQAVARNYEGVVIPALKAKIRWGLLSAVGGFTAAAYYYINGNNTLAISFLIIAGFLPFIDSFGIYTNFLEGRKLFDKGTIYGCITQIIAVGIMITTLFINNNLFIILFVYFCSRTLLRTFFFVYVMKKYKPNKKYDPKTISYGKHSSMVNITATLIGSLDGIILFHFLGAAGLAVYSFALAPVLQLRAIVNKMPILALPKLAKRPLKEIKPLLWKRMLVLFIAGLAISFVYILISPFVFKIFFPQYLDSLIFSQVFSLTIALTLGQSIFGAVIGSRITSIPKKFLYLWNIPVVVLTVSMFILVQYMGIMGIIVSRIIFLITVTLVGLIIWKKINKLEDHKIASVK